MDRRTKIRIIRPTALTLMALSLIALLAMIGFILIDITSGNIGCKADEVNACFFAGTAAVAADFPLAMHLDYLENEEKEAKEK